MKDEEENEKTDPEAKPADAPTDEYGQKDVTIQDQEVKPEGDLSRPTPSPSPPPSSSAGRHEGENKKGGLEFRNKMREARIRKYEGKLRRVYDLAKQKGKITNDDIQKHLRVSDATATRYARELVKRGLLRKSGTKKSTYYEAV
ncbi:MAG: MarR family transcriptional regulator [bacterium]|nr:MarR family transcriptional regulator [bacterium]